ncbi:hypothetical protein RS130_08210 [Paraglaciecola aquimarina]|uniref:Extradiol ring-cleavage dioxygenase LigAB LigA subunit domain-containing protein n=1 Tax=Paraglaciecola aquimarina TaxID=1235557 RepID=A0ABU3SV95_9ALTE|nr:hypothetical protein [Paraglaciecola aquimarina]MDU0353912.1 hypothetical protein [Paraglaciecola aquimarina]
MSNSLLDFLHELDTNAQLKEAYLANPVATATDYGLAEEDIEIIKTKDWDAVRKRYEDSGKAIKTQSY